MLPIDTLSINDGSYFLNDIYLIYRLIFFWKYNFFFSKLLYPLNLSPSKKKKKNMTNVFLFSSFEELSLLTTGDRWLFYSIPFSSVQLQFTVPNRIPTYSVCAFHILRWIIYNNIRIEYMKGCSKSESEKGHKSFV